MAFRVALSSRKKNYCMSSTGSIGYPIVSSPSCSRATSGRRKTLIDQSFNSSEKRPASTLLLARYGIQEQLDRKLPRVSRPTFVGMVRTTRSSVNAFMNKFRALNICRVQPQNQDNTSLLTVVFDERGGKDFLKTMAHSGCDREV